jgi:hypothetical protein
MKVLPTLLAVALLTVALVGCGGSGKGSPSTSRAASTGTASASGASSTGASQGTATSGVGVPMSAYEPPTHLPGLKGDGDRDVRSWDDGYRSPDNDEDPALDHQPSDANEGYRDADDLDSLSVGHPASAADTKAIEALVKRYYAVAVTGNGAKACSMMARGFARGVPVDYGKFGPPYLHGLKTCAAIVSLQFKHFRSRITSAIRFTAVHQDNNADRAYALFGSRTTPAGFIDVNRENGVWKIGALLGGPMP